MQKQLKIPIFFFVGMICGVLLLQCATKPVQAESESPVKVYRSKLYNHTCYYIHDDRYNAAVAAISCLPDP